MNSTRTPAPGRAGGPGTRMRPELALLGEHPEVSVLIVGGGINGVGLLRELALQGVDVLLVEKSDFCAGTSAAMTRVIHGGLRYLENAEFRLVRESLRERNRLLGNAPHYVKPLPTTIPIFSWTSGMVPAVRNVLGWPAKPGNRGALLIKTGLTLYDLLAGRKSTLPKHRFRSRREALALRPALNPDVVCTATYYDARITHPERLCLELAQDAEAAFAGARALNYVRLESGAGNAVVLRDEVSGGTCQVRPRVVVNATGAWIDLTNRGLGRESRFIGGTKGSHLVLDHPELVKATGDDMIYFVNRDGRICIFYAVCGKIIAGATDVPTEDPEAVCDEDEVKYILEAMRLAFPAIRVDRSHVVFRFCGVRPLPRSNALTPGQISRDHSFPVLPAGQGVDFPIYSLVGGKWTTFRALAEQAADEILRFLGRPRIRDSADIPIGGGKGYPGNAGTPGTAPGAAGNAAGTLWHGGGARRRVPGGGTGCAALRPRRLFAPGDRIHRRAGAGGASGRPDPEANVNGDAGRSEPLFAGRIGGDCLAGARLVARGHQGRGGTNRRNC